MSPMTLRPELRQCAQDIKTLRRLSGMPAVEYYLRTVARLRGLRIARAMQRLSAR